MPSEIAVAIFDGPGQPLRLESWQAPRRVGEGEVLAEIRLATICGSDLHTIDGHRQEPTPCVLGHEAVAEVVTAGSGREELVLGDRITWSIADSCGNCPACADYGLPQKCQALFKYGHASIHDGGGLNGCYASHILLRAGTHIVKVPDGLPDEVVAPANCALATMVNAIERLPDHCETVVVQGAGLLGIYACALLHARGLQQIFCIDVQPHRLNHIQAFGATAIDGRAAMYPVARQLIEDAAPSGVDAVLEVCGASAVVDEGVRLLRPGGHYVFVGMVHPGTRLELTGEQIVRKCLTIHGVHNYAPRHLERAIAFLKETADQFPYADLVSPPYALADLARAIDVARGQEWHRVSIQP